MRKKRYLCCTLSLSVMPQTVVLTLKPEEAADVHRYAPLAARAAGVAERDVALLRVVKRSIDARQRQLKVHLTLELYADGEPQPAPVHFDYPLHNESTLQYRLFLKSPASVILTQMKGILISSFLLLLLIICAFIYLLRTILKQKTVEELKTDFTNNMTHELKTPISAIMMSLQLLEDKRVGGLNPEQEELSRSIKENSERLLSITGELLNMTQVESGKLQLKPKITKPIELIDYAIKANRVQAEKFGIQVEVDYPEKIGKLFVDSEKIAWVLTNLLSNAVRYSSEAGRVVIGARQQDDNHIAMFVQDFGKGIDPRYHESIFEHYFRVPGTKVQGTGLGLSISRDFVEAHGGTLTVDSELGKGSVFTMVLPC